MIFGDFVEGEDGGVLDGGHGLDLHEGSLAGFGGTEGVGRDDFEGDFSIWFELAGPVNDAHATVADFFEDFVVWNLRTIIDGVIVFEKTAPEAGWAGPSEELLI